MHRSGNIYNLALSLSEYCECPKGEHVNEHNDSAGVHILNTKREKHEWDERTVVCLYCTEQNRQNRSPTRSGRIGTMKTKATSSKPRHSKFPFV